MAPRNEEQKEKNRLGSQALREKKNQMAKAKKESAQKSKKKHTEKVKLEKEQEQRQRDEAAMASIEEEDELPPTPMKTPVAWRRNQQQQQVVRGQNAAVVAAFERSFEREHEADRELTATANNAMTLAQYSMEKVARGRGESSVREKDFRALLSSGTDQPLAFGDQHNVILEEIDQAEGSSPESPEGSDNKILAARLDPTKPLSAEPKVLFAGTAPNNNSTTKTDSAPASLPAAPAFSFGNNDDADTDFSDDDDDSSWAPPHAPVLSALIAQTLQSPYPSQSRNGATSTNTRTSWKSVSVTDPNMVSEQARRRRPFLAAAAAEFCNDDGDGDDSQKGKRIKENEAVRGDKWICTKCDTSNDGMEGQCTNCNVRYVPVQSGPTLGWGNAAFATSFENKWKCETCTTFNDNEVDTCASCEARRAGGGETTSTGDATTMVTATTTNADIGPGGFSFGGAAPAPSSTMTVSVGGFSFQASAPAVASTAVSSSSAPVTTGGFSFLATSTTTSLSVPTTTGGFVFGAPPAAIAPTTASTAANDDNNETSSGLHLGDFGSAPTVSEDSMDDVPASSKERKKKKRSADKANDGAAPNAKRVKRS